MSLGFIKKLLVMVLLINSQSFSASLTGQWLGVDTVGETSYIVFRADGTGDIDGERFSYQLIDDMLTLRYGDGGELSFICYEQDEGWILAMGEEYALELFPMEGEYSEEDGMREDESSIIDAPQQSAHQEKRNSPVSGIAGSGIRFIMDDGQDQYGWYGIDPQTQAIEAIRTFSDEYICSPGISSDGSVVIFAVRHPRQPRLTGEVRGKPFELAFPADIEMQVRHPTVSRDGRLLAFTLKSSRHVGTIDVHDWNSGAYDHSFMAIGTWYKIVSINLDTGKQQAVYHDDELVPDVMKKRGLGPVFSPTDDILIYADNLRVYVCDAISGKNLRTFSVPTGTAGGWTGTLEVSEYSGMAFSPDGRTVAYMSQGEADIAISPHIIVLMDAHSGEARYFPLPQESSLSGSAKRGLIYLDFSPDGRHIVFSASAYGQQGEVGPFLCLLDLQTGSVSALDAAGVNASDPVWKGR